jgi:hydroxypyruvate isomerase
MDDNQIKRNFQSITYTYCKHFGNQRCTAITKQGFSISEVGWCNADAWEEVVKRFKQHEAYKYLHKNNNEIQLAAEVKALRESRDRLIMQLNLQTKIIKGATND